MWGPATMLHSDYSRRHEPDSILVVALFNQYPLWVQHAIRGWELPGGKIERGEQPEQAVQREAIEEAGVTLEHITWLAEYAYPDPELSNHECERYRWKWIYTAHVIDATVRTARNETLDVQVMRPMPTPEDVKRNANFSNVMKDHVYEFIWGEIRRRGLSFQE